jgi:hypothetical protein
MMAGWHRVFNWRYYHWPVFVIGTGRSGTTVLLEALGAHPKLLSAWGEAPVLRDIGRMAGRYTADDHEGAYIRRATHLSERRYLGSLRRMAFESCFGPDGGLWMRFRANAERAVKYRRLPLRARSVTHWCAKTELDRASYEGLSSLYPKARFLWIVRNGLAVVNSRRRFHGFRDMDFAQQCETWATSVDTYSYVGDSERALELRHEELVMDPDALFRRVFDFLEIRAHPGPAQFCRSTLIHPLDQKTEARTDVRKALEERNAGWQDWSDEEKETFQRICGEAMETMGYSIRF